MNDYTLHIRMFGEFSITNRFHSFIPSTNKSLQVTRLISYLLANKGIEVSKDKLIDILWADGSCTNPAGALRNLIYRARQELSYFFKGLEPAPECIFFSRNAYIWNPDIDCDIDIYNFEHFTTLSQKEQDAKIQYAYDKQAHDLYNGEFLPMQAAEEWVIFRSVYYKNLYTKSTLNMCKYLGAQGKFNDVIELCDSSTLIDQMDEQIHKEKLNAYLNIGAIQQALDYYYAISDLFTQKFGVDLSSSMHDIYGEIVKRLPNYQLSIKKLEENLRDEHNRRGTFYCNFDIFKNIYQINLRSVRRSQSKRYLTLFTLMDSKYPDMLTNDIKAEMKILHHILANNLRSNDVFTQSSPTQFSLILTVVNENGFKIAINRICEKYNAKKEHDNISFEIETKLIQ